MVSALARCTTIRSFSKTVGLGPWVHRSGKIDQNFGFKPEIERGILFFE